MAAVAASGKRAEYQALEVITDVFGAALDDLPGIEGDHPLFHRVAAHWSAGPADGRRTGFALDLALIHVASMSNLFAALGWALVDLVAHPTEAALVAGGDRRLAESCVRESTRLAQRSIMARYVLKPLSMEVDDRTLEIPPGVTVATLLPLTNTSAAPGLDVWDPAHWNGRRLADSSQLATVELVTVFGHGRHTCPAQPFSLSAMSTAVCVLLAEFDLEAAWSGPASPVPAQIGGVARSAAPCPLRYHRKARASA
jgi:cytochrome P450